MNANISGGGGGGGGGLPASYTEALASALRSASAIPGIEGTIPTSRCTSRLVVGSIVNEDPGGGPLSLWCQFRLPASLAANAGVCGLSPSETHILGASGSDAIGLAIMSGDLQLVMGNSSTYTHYALGVASLVGQVVDVVITRSESTLAAYVNGTPVTLTAVNVNGSVAPNATITATWAHALAPLSSTITNSNVASASPVHRLVLYNRVLSPAEAALVHVLGVDVADQWGSHAPLISATVLNGGFETPGAGGSDVFANWQEIVLGTSTIAQDTSVFFEGAASARMTTDALGSYTGVRTTIATGKRYRVRFAFRHDRPGSNIIPQITAGADFPGLAAVAPNTWSVQTVEGVSTAAQLDISRRSGAAYANVNFWYDGIVVTRIGAVLDLQFDGTCGFQAADRANQLDATLFNGCGFTLPDAHSGFARWIAAAPAGERMGGSAGIAIPANCAIGRIVVRNIDIGNGQTFNLGSSAASKTDIVSAPLNGNGSVNIIDPASSISTTGQLWISYTGTGSIEVSVFFQPF